jgi:aryl-alcohol dehydrogenase-like predicted oxidoreductase
MEYVRFGKTEQTVSRLGFGGAPAGLGNYLEPYDPSVANERQEVVDAIWRAVELGVTYFDTAAGYGNGAGESIFGDALSQIDKKIFLATKLSPDNADARASVMKSLERLRVNNLDLIQIHGSSYSDESTTSILSVGGLLEQLEALRDEGLVCFIGFTTEDNNSGIYRFMQSGRFDIVQMTYNLLHQHPAEQTRPFGSMFEAEKQDMGICTMRTLTSGIFQKWVKQANPGDDFDYSASLLNFVLSNPLVDVALVGMRTPKMVEANVKICEDSSQRIDLGQLHEKYV